MTIQAIAWSEDRRSGQPPPGTPQTSHPGRLKRGHHSLHCSLNGGGCPWHCLPQVAERKLRTADGLGGQGRALRVPTVTAWGVSKVGLPSLRLHSLSAHLDR